MVMSVHSRTSVYTALRPAGSPARTRVVQPTVHRNQPEDHVPEKDHDVGGVRHERTVTDEVSPEVRAQLDR